jgi:hypothetical protein
MNQDADAERYFSKLQLFQRCWTSADIRKFLGKPHWRRKNRFWGAGLGICLYLQATVFEIERSQAFADWKAGASARETNSRKAEEAKRLKRLQKEHMTKEETLDALAKRFPEADIGELGRFLESRYNGDPGDFESMVEAWGTRCRSSGKHAI